MAASANLASSFDVEQVELTAQGTAVLRGTVRPAGIPAFLGHAFSVVAEVAGSCGAQLTGPPYARYTVGADTFAITAGFPVDRALPQRAGVESDELPAGPALRVLHVGAYADVGPGYQACESWLAAHHKAHQGDPWESYLGGPEVEHPRTVVYTPFRDWPNDDDHGDS